MWKLLSVAILLTALSCAPDAAESVPPYHQGNIVRVATFNVSMYRTSQGALIEELAGGGSPQIEAVAKIITTINPDILVLNEIDYDLEFQSLQLFRDGYLSASGYDHIYMVPSNTGVNPGVVDFDNSGKIETTVGSREYANDSFGYGQFPGQYGMAILSKHPLLKSQKRSFKQFKWRDMPDNLLPVDYYSTEAQAAFRLSSKNHLDMPVEVNGERISLLLMHPTPPTFDGPEDRNGRRNHDEIRLFADYLSQETSDYLVDDKGGVGGLSKGDKFILLGDFNADPNDGDSYTGAIQQLLEHPLVNNTPPVSKGAWEAAAAQAGVNDTQIGPHEHDTADFRDSGRFAAGNLRLDYVLPSKAGFSVIDSGVFWPEEDEEGYDLVGNGFPVVSSDHRLVWVDLKITN